MTQRKIGERQEARPARSRNSTERKRAEEALLESERLLRTVVTNAPVILFAVDREGVHTLMDGKGLDALGWEPSDIVGRSVFDVYRSRPDILENVRRALAGEAFSTTIEITGLVFETHYVPIRDQEGQSSGFIGVAVDITERKRAEEALRESERRFRTLSEAGFEGIAIHDKGRILEANQALATMFGYELSEVIGMHALDFTAPESRDLLLQNILSSYREPFELTGLRKDGTTFPIEVCGRPVPYRGKMVRIAALRDITDRKRAQEALQKAREELEARVERQMERGNPYGLTFRELTVLHLVAAGKADKEIGHHLGISPLTASKHLANILDKMGAASRTEAGVRALREGLLD